MATGKRKTAAADTNANGKKPKKKLLPLSSLEKKLDRVFSLFIRTRNIDEGGTTNCVTCNRLFYYADLDAGHFVKRQHKSVRWDERNVHPQCTRCNRFLNGAMDEMALYIYKLYGQDTLCELLRLKHTTKKYHRSEIEELISIYENKIEENERRNRHRK